LYDSINNIPIEAKTVRNKQLDEPKPFQVEQLQMYMTLVGADRGYILYQLLLDYNDFPFRVFEVNMTKAEREIMMEKMVSDAFHLQMNIDNKTPELTKHIALNQEKNWKCSYCKYMDECYDMRAKNGEI
jgi:CRISPR/Cas system-associated exonuclease Cas4 (RecB family)